MVVTPLYEYFLLDDMFELNRSIEDLGASEFTSMILKKHLILDLNRKILAKNIALTLLSFIHIGNYPRVVVIYGMIIPLSVEVSNCICETVFADRLFEGSLSCFKQWNPGDNYLIFNYYYYYTKRVLMEMVAKAVLLVIKLLELEKGYATSNALMFATTILKSSIMVISWDPGKFNTLMTRVAYQCCLRNSLSIYRLLNLVFYGGKIWLKSILVLLMLVYDRGKFWSLSIWVQMMSGLGVFIGLTPMCFSSELKGYLAAKRLGFRSRESEGSFQYGNYWTEVDDLHAVAQHFRESNRVIRAIVGHSKGGDVVLLYASIYHDIKSVVNLSGRYDLKEGIEERLGKDYLERIKKDSFIDVRTRTGSFDYRVTKESLMDRLSTNMHEACQQIDKECRVLTIHGSSDKIIPVQSAREFAKIIPNHKLHIIRKANHAYSNHQDELSSQLL
ncbi:alpha/beta-Hydrolases superfamily protein [Trifolium repens]|nr:alpha/beta-Hydrolases superfamily protein [Trifolium repens]